MATIKEIAAMAGVSPSTVSIVANGRSEERHIPLVTQEKVLDAMRKLHYTPNIASRKLRQKRSDTLTISVFWASDFRVTMMIRFLRGLRKAAFALGEAQRVELMFHFYENDFLKDSLQSIEMSNAAIICNASEKDLGFLESHRFITPIILYNRPSETYCCVRVDNWKIGEIAADILAKRGHKKAVILTAESVFSGMLLRRDSFAERISRNGMELVEFNHENSMAGGYAGGLEIVRSAPDADCLFCASDYMAIGALKALLRSGVRIPEDMELISVGNADSDLEEYAAVSLSVVEVPIEKMGAACFNEAMKVISGEIQPPYTEMVELQYICRESCGD